MLLLVSPAKTLDSTPPSFDQFTLPRFQEESWQLASVLKKKSARSLKSLMGISDKLAEQNYARFQNFEPTFHLKNSKQALHTFKGDVYLGLQADTFKKSDIAFAQKHLRILSGLYGVLRPLDLIQEYRLEMGTSLKVKRNKNLYAYWGSKLTDIINSDLKENESKFLINLASNEYFKAIDRKKVEAEIIDIEFKEDRGGTLKFISFTAKKARGSMAQFIIKNRIKKVEDLKNFNIDGYAFREDLSTSNNWTFVM